MRTVVELELSECRQLEGSSEYVVRWNYVKR